MIKGAENGVEMAALGVGSNTATNAIMKQAEKIGLTGAKGVSAKELVNLATDVTAYGLVSPYSHSVIEGVPLTSHDIAQGSGIEAMFRLKGGTENLLQHGKLNRALKETNDLRQGVAISNFMDATPESIGDVHEMKQSSDELNLAALKFTKEAKATTDLQKKQNLVAKAMMYSKAANVKWVTEEIQKNPNLVDDISNSELSDNVKQSILNKIQQVSDEINSRKEPQQIQETAPKQEQQIEPIQNEQGQEQNTQNVIQQPTEAEKPTTEKANEIVKPTEEGQGIESVDENEVIKRMKPFTDEMVKIEREFKNKGYDINTDYDNGIQVLDKNGEQVESQDLPKELQKLAANYEKATSNLGEFDEKSLQKSLKQSREFTDTNAEVVEQPKLEEQKPTETKPISEQKEEKTFAQKDLDRAEAKKIHAKVREMDEPTDAEQIALRYLAEGGKIGQDAINEVAGTVKRARLNTGERELKSAESKARDYTAQTKDLKEAEKKGWDLNSLDKISEKLAQEHSNEEREISEKDVKNALMEAISNHNTRLEASKSYLERYSPEYKEEQHYKRIIEEHEEQVQKEYDELERQLRKDLDEQIEGEASEEHINNLIKQYESEFKAENQQPESTSKGETTEKTSSRTSGEKTTTTESEKTKSGQSEATNKEVESLTNKNKENALPITSAEEILQRKQGELGTTGGERGRMESGEQGSETTTESKSTQETTQKENGGSGGSNSTNENEGISREEGIGITHADTEELRKELGISEYEKIPQEEIAWETEAKNRIRNGELPKLLTKLRNGENISEVEQKMMGQHIANLNEEVSKSPTNENISKYREAIELSDKAGSASGRSLRARQGMFLADDSLSGEFVKEMESLGVTELTDAEKKTVMDEYKEMSEVKQKLSEAELRIKELEAEAKAKEELNSIRNTNKNKPQKKSKEDYVKERSSLKDELKAAKEKHEKWLKDNNINTMGGSPFVLTTDMAKIIAKIVKSHAEETVSKFEDLVENVYNEVKDVLEGVSKKDIVNVMAGVYNEKKETVEDAAAKIFDYKQEAKLLKKLEDARLNQTLNPTKDRAVKSNRIKELENKIKEIRERNKDNTPVEKSDSQKMAEKRKSLLKKIESLQNDVKAGKFEKTKPKEPILLDKKTQALQDRVIELEAQQATRRAKQEYEKLNKFEKGMDTFWQIAGLRRLVNAAVDFSVMFRQARDITLNPLKYVKIENGKLKSDSAAKAWVNTFNATASVKWFKRFQYNLEKSDLGRSFMHFGGVFSNPTEVKMEKREEEFSNSLLSRMHQKIESGNNEGLKKVANTVDRLWFSERAAAAALNTIRIEEYTKGVKELTLQGKTMDNSPQEYKDLVKWVMNITGRGNMVKVLEDSHAGRIIANRTYFGARLMAAKINMLNPATYIGMQKSARVRALKDMAGSTAGFLLIAAAGVAAGGSVSTDWDDPDFLQLRFGKNVYDISGGSAAYVRTFLRFLKAISKQSKNPNSKAANSYSTFAGKSMAKTL